MTAALQALQRNRSRYIAAGFFLLFLSPIVIYWAYFHFARPISPFFEKYDPEFPFLMNSLEVFKGRPYYFADHPGTPLEILGTLLYAALFPFLHKSPAEFVLYNLQNPGLFLNLAHAFLTVANMACALLFFVTVNARKRLDEMLVAAALAMLFFAIHPMSLLAASTWSHNSFAFPFGTLLLLFLFRTLDHQPPHEIPRRQLVLLGIGSGLLTAVTIYFGAWFIGVLLAILLAYRWQAFSWRKTWQALATVAAAGLAAFVLVTLPILYRLGYFLQFIVGIFTHQTSQLIKAPETPTATAMASALRSLPHDLPVLSFAMGAIIVLALAAWAAWRPHIAEKPGPWSVLLALLVQLLALTLVLLTRYQARYLLSVAAIVPVLVLALLRIAEWKPPVARTVNVLMALVIAVELVMSLNSQMRNHRSLADQIDEFTRQQTLAIQAYAAKTGRAESSVVVLWTYSTYSPCYALWFGNGYSGNAFAAELERLCPSFYVYNIFAKRGDRISMVSGDDSSPVPRAAGSAGEISWDIFIGCEAALRRDPTFQAASYTVTNPDRSLRVNCGQGGTAPLAIVFRR